MQGVALIVLLTFTIAGLALQWRANNPDEISQMISIFTESLTPPSPTSVPSPAPRQSPPLDEKRETTPTPQSKFKPEPTKGVEKTWVYPGSTLTSSSSDSLRLVSNDDPGTVTNWYKNAIREAGFRTTTNVVTNTNGVASNLLRGSNGSESISIKISSTSASDTEISVSF